MSAQLHRKTPTLNVIDSRGLTVRQVAYWRSDAAKTAQARVTRQEHDVAGRPIAHWDPRLFGQTTKANLTNIHSLSGKLLKTDSVDAGWRVNLPGDAGHVLRSWDQRGSYQQTTYDIQLRPICIEEQAVDQVLRVVERLNYGDNSQASAASNSCGALTRHDDNAGTLLISEYALCAKPLAQTRRFLLDPQLPDWPANAIDRDGLLEEGDGHETTWGYDALGESVQQVDAGKHQQGFEFDVAGQLKTISLLIKDTKVATTVIKDLVYNAAGQVESQTAGNGVTSRAVFDSASGRMTSLSASVSTSTLQDLHYTYDAVGNVLRIEDKAQPVHFGSNQKVKAISAFTYDSLYQLTCATGRESAVQTTQLHLAATSRSPIDAQQLFNYSEHYQYDAGGNLTELRHARDGNNYTRTFKVAAANNRLQSWNKGDTTPDITSGFDAGGNQQQLNPGQVLEWNTRNQLSSVMLVARAEGRDDIERYYYDSSGQRVRKVQTTHAASIVHHREVRYLPGLEIRTRSNERLEVITLQAGRCSVRYLHWTTGRPAGITADQMRYSLDDHLGSSSLELDDQAWLISQESYLPYGGTAWAASRSALEADYRTIRYSGKERDASGLYYYGHRYYAPWLQRWISPDPAGAIDGLNLYCMVGNNPVRFTDPTGMNRQESLNYLDLADANLSKIPGYVEGQSRNDFVDAALRNSAKAKRHYQIFKQDVMNAVGEANTNRTKTFNQLRNLTKPWRYDRARFSDPVLTSALLDKHTAFSAIGGDDDDLPMTAFHNFPGSLSRTNPFPGITFHNAREGEEDTFHVSNLSAFMKGVRSAYSKNKISLHGFFRKRIARHVTEQRKLPVSAGIPGLHAEVVAANAWMILGPRSRLNQRLSYARIFTARLQKRGRGNDFPACFNCSAILPPFVSVVTGRRVTSR
ncbi:RHS repeat-associated core domain-containing protein [Pseudomonas sp. TMB3-21]